MTVIDLAYHREQRARVLASLTCRPEVYPVRKAPAPVVVRPFPTQPDYPPAA